MDNTSAPRRRILSSPAFWTGCFLCFYNNAVNLMPPALHARIYVGLNLLVLVIIWFYARQYWDFRASEAGVGSNGLGRSLGMGAGLVAGILFPFFVALMVLPRVGIFLPPINLAEVDQEGLLRRLLIRIPLGTALFEEILFRGLFLGLLSRKTAPVRALKISSLVFCAWHVVPALKVLLQNFNVDGILPGTGMFLLGMLGAGLAGYVFGWIRLKTGNIAGPLIAHVLINDIALVMLYYLW